VSGPVAAAVGSGRISEAVRRAAKFLAESGDNCGVSDGGSAVHEAVERVDMVVRAFGAGSPEASAAVGELERVITDAEGRWVGEQLLQPASPVFANTEASWNLLSLPPPASPAGRRLTATIEREIRLMESSPAYQAARRARRTRAGR
jgi:hypothetical protein